MRRFTFCMIAVFVFITNFSSEIFAEEISKKSKIPEWLDFYMDIERVRREAMAVWNKQRNGSILMVSGGLVMANLLPPSGGLVVGCLGFLYVALQPPPSGQLGWFRRV